MCTKRVRATACAVALAALAGCLFVPVGYPTWTRTPAVQVNAPGEEIVAVVVERKTIFTNWTPFGLPETHEEIVGLVNIDASRRLEAQNALTWDGGVAGFIFVAPVLAAGRTTREVRLYRPGCQTVTVPAWANVDQIVWRPASGVQEQMQALERINVKESALSRAEQQLFCLFLAREYDRLAAASSNLPDGGKLQEVLTANAQTLVGRAKGLENDLPKPPKADADVRQAGHQDAEAK